MKNILRQLENFGHFIRSWLFNLIYGYPLKDFKVIFVTGTDGKTTTSTFIYNILNSAGMNVGLVSTVEAKIKDISLDTGLHTTTPSNKALQEILVQLKKHQCEYLVMEYTAHGIDQSRVVGANVIASVFTNITNEHLDYSGTLENLIETKGKIIKLAKKSYFNAKCAVVKKLVEIAKRTDSDYELYTSDFLKESLPNDWSQKFPGEYNLENASAAYFVTRSLGVPDNTIVSAIANSTPPVGRFEEIKNETGIKIYIDFAHTPNALKEVLTASKKLFPSSKLIVVFGSAGLRDKYKRPVMGQHAKELADYVVITAEDPRTEDVNIISRQIAEGCIKAGGVENKDFFIKVDRQEAIDFAITKLATAGDVVLITGKSHEKSMCFGNTEYPWSDFDAVHKVIKKMKNNVS